MKEFWIPRAGANMRYQDLPGEKLPILFVHGLGCAGSFDYPEVAAQPALRDHRCILVDLLGAGYSDRPADFGYRVSDHADCLLDLIDALQLKRFALFGHSLGGAVALTLAAKCEGSLAQIILSEPNLDPSPEGATSRTMAGFAAENFALRGLPMILARSRQQGNTMWAAALSSWLPAAAHHISQSAVEGGNPAWREVLYALRCPRTLLFGAHTPPDPATAELLSHGVRVDTVPAAGHSMAWENPSGLAEAIARALAATPATSSGGN